jgi:uncharacterized membrane protein
MELEWLCSENGFYKLFLGAIIGSAVLKFGTEIFCVSRHIIDQVA